jgi:hypothetical protein
LCVIKGQGEFSVFGNTVARGSFRDDVTLTPAGVPTGGIIFLAGTLAVTDIGGANCLLQSALGGPFSIILRAIGHEIHRLVQGLPSPVRRPCFPRSRPGRDPPGSGA